MREFGLAMLPSPRLRSLIRLVIAVALPGSLAQCQLPGSGITSHRLSRLAPDWQGVLCWIAQLCPMSSHLSASAKLKTYKLTLRPQQQPLFYVSTCATRNNTQNLHYVNYNMVNSSLEEEHLILNHRDTNRNKLKAGGDGCSKDKMFGTEKGIVVL